jgi:Tol biopolymer transport system component
VSGRVIVAAALALAGCAGPGAVDPKRLPESPLAVLYRNEDLALDRADAIRDLRKRGTPSEKEGVIRIETLDAMFGGTPEAEHRLRALQGQLALVDPRSGDAKVIHGLPPAAKPLSWSPDRSKLLLVGRWREGAQLFVWDRATEQAEIVTSGAHEHPMGCIGDGGRIVAVEARRVAGGWSGSIVAMPRPGAGLRAVTQGPSDVLPTCAPQGSLVAFVTATEDGATAIAVLDLDAPDAKPRVIARGMDPVFAPDGEWIVYAAPTAQGSRLFRIRADGAGRTAVGPGPEQEMDPAVSPDGAYVVYVVTSEDGRERVRVRRYDGSGDRPLVTSGDASSPVW